MLYPFQEQEDSQQHGNNELGPLSVNAFDLIILSQGLNLESLFDKGKVIFYVHK